MTLTDCLGVLRPGVQGRMWYYHLERESRFHITVMGNMISHGYHDVFCPFGTYLKTIGHLDFFIYNIDIKVFIRVRWN